jgi:regulator of sigma E protease
MSYVLAFLGFAALIILHEFGHFVAAKAVGMRVERFSLFFGPLLVKVRRGETEYGIAPIPLGGYVKITGMSPREEIPPEVVPRAYYNQPVWKRIVVILAGPFVNLLIAFVILALIFAVHGIYKTTSTTSVDRAGLIRPASTVLRPGDRILAVDGVQHPSLTKITSLIASHRCPVTTVSGCRAEKPVRLTVERAGQTLTFSIRPFYDSHVGRMRLGFEFGTSTKHVYYRGVSAAGKSVSEMWHVTSATVSTFAKLFEPQARNQLHGTVGAFKVTQQEFSYGTVEALFTLALISLSLAVINLFPFLPLDGGHVFWALAEKVRGRRIPFEVMERAGAVGFLLILIIFAIGLSNDISTLTGRGFVTR